MFKFLTYIKINYILYYARYLDRHKTMMSEWKYKIYGMQ